MMTSDNNTFVLYKRISAQYTNQDILDYVRRLIPEEIVKKTKIEDKEEPLKSILQWFKRDFMRWIPKDPKCEMCNLPMSPSSLEEFHGICEAQRDIYVIIVA